MVVSQHQCFRCHSEKEMRMANLRDGKCICSACIEALENETERLDSLIKNEESRKNRISAWDHAASACGWLCVALFCLALILWYGEQRSAKYYLLLLLGIVVFASVSSVAASLASRRQEAVSKEAHIELSRLRRMLQPA